MAGRKPSGVNWESWVDKQIREAEAAGSFASASKGPIPDLDRPYDPDWWVKELIEREQLDAAPAPLRERSRIRQAILDINTAPDEASVRHQVDAINERIRVLNMGINTPAAVQVPQVNVEAMIRRWRQHRQS